MPASIRKDDKSKRIVLDILGPPPGGVVDCHGKVKKYKRKSKKNEEGQAKCKLIL